jgi:hypothetical protein
LSSTDGRIKPKRREINPVRRTPKGQCVGCQHFETADHSICLWKLEAQLDKAVQHINIAIVKQDPLQTVKASYNMNNALCLIRKITAKQRELYRVLPTENMPFISEKMNSKKGGV